jgi:hypothetical protein
MAASGNASAVAVAPDSFHRFRNEAIVGSLVYDIFHLLKAPKFVRVALTSAVLSASSKTAGQRLPPSYAGVDDATWGQVVASITPDTLLAHWRELEAAFFVLNAVGAQLSAALQQPEVQAVALPVLLPVLRCDIALLPAPLARTLFRLLSYLRRWLVSADVTQVAVGAAATSGGGVLSAAIQCCLRGCLVPPDGEDEDEEGEGGDEEEGGGGHETVYASADSQRDGSMVCAAAAHTLQGLVTIAPAPLLQLGLAGELASTAQRMVVHRQPTAACVSVFQGMGSLAAHVTVQDPAQGQELVRGVLTPLLEVIQGPLLEAGEGGLLDDQDRDTVCNCLVMLQTFIARAKPIRAAPTGGAGGALTPLLAAFDLAWPLLQHIFAAQSADEVLVARACSVLKAFLLCLRWALAPMAAPLCAQLARLAGKHGAAAPLRLLHTAVEVFAGPAVHVEVSDATVGETHRTLHQAVFIALYACTPVRVANSSSDRPTGEAATALGDVLLTMLPALAIEPLSAELVQAARGALPNITLPGGGVPPALRPFVEAPSCILQLLLPLAQAAAGQEDAEATRGGAKLVIAACRAAGDAEHGGIAQLLASTGADLLLSFLRALLSPGAQLTHMKLSEAAAHLGCVLGMEHMGKAVLQTLLAARADALAGGAAFGRLSESDVCDVVHCWVGRGGHVRPSMALLSLLSEVIRGQEEREALIALGMP